MNKNIIIAAVIGALVIGGGSFYAGMTYQKSQAPSRGQFGGQFSRGMGGTRGAGGGFTTGTILSKDDKSITVQLPNNGGTKIVFYTSAVPVTKSVSGSATDLTVGERVMVVGSSNQDGSVSAESIQTGMSGFASTTRGFGGQ